MKKLCFIDCETTGTDPKQHGLIQLAGVIVIDGEEKETFNYSIRPFLQDIIDDGALAVNKKIRQDIEAQSEPRTIYLSFSTAYTLKIERGGDLHDAFTDIRLTQKLYNTLT